MLEVETYLREAPGTEGTDLSISTVYRIAEGSQQAAERVLPDARRAQFMILGQAGLTFRAHAKRV